MAVMRMGYVHARVTDLAEAKNHYASALSPNIKVSRMQTCEHGARMPRRDDLPRITDGECTRSSPRTSTPGRAGSICSAG